MMFYMTAFGTLEIENAGVVHDSASGAEVFHVRDPHALIQAAGYIKHVYATTKAQNVFYRGQTRYFDGMSPSLFRGISKHSTQSKNTHILKSFITTARTQVKRLGKLPEEIVEPLLQQYGLRTSWVDLVDNIWVALWFACHRAYVAGSNDKYLHFEKRHPQQGSEPQFAYVVLLAMDATEGSATPGFWRGPTTELTDLRVGVPSIFLRPHAQHGVLFRLRGGPERRELDYRSAVVGVIRVDLLDALDWLGQGSLLDVHALFPPPHYDFGYQILLETLSEGKHSPEPSLGSIQHVGA